MFSWSANRVKPKMKATYTRKKLLNPLYQTGQLKHTPTYAEDASSITVLSQEDNGYDNDSMDDGSMEVVHHPHIASSIQPDENSKMIGEDDSLAINESAVVAKAANAQVLKETVSTIKRPSKKIQDKEDQEDKEDDEAEEDNDDNEDNEDNEDDEDDEDEPLFEVEYFMADDYRKLPGRNIPQEVLLTKWAGFDRVDELTWEPEADMRADVQHLVEAYYQQKSTGPSSKPSQEVIKPSRGRPKKGTTNSLGKSLKDGNPPRGRGRPPKDSNALRGRPSKVTKGTPGRPRKDGNPPRGRGRPPKAANTEPASQPKSSGARRGRPRKAQSSEAEQN